MKTKIFYLTLILVATMVSFSSCSKEDDDIVPETPKEEPTDNLIINLTQLSGSWDFQSVKIGNNTYTTTDELGMAGYEKYPYVMDLKFTIDAGMDYIENKQLHQMRCYPDFGSEWNEFFYKITSDNKISYNKSYTIQIQSYNTTTKVLVFKVISVMDKITYDYLLNCIYTYKKK